MTTSGMVHEMAVAGSGRLGPSVQRRRGLHAGLWVAQGLLAAAFGMAGLMHATRPIALSSTVGSEAWNSRDLKSRPH